MLLDLTPSPDEGFACLSVGLSLRYWLPATPQRHASKLNVQVVGERHWNLFTKILINKTTRNKSESQWLSGPESNGVFFLSQLEGFLLLICSWKLRLKLLTCWQAGRCRTSWAGRPIALNSCCVQVETGSQWCCCQPRRLCWAFPSVSMGCSKWRQFGGLTDCHHQCDLLV